MKTFTMPDLGEGLQEAEVVAWHVAEGERVVADQPLVSVETDKAVVEIPVPHAATVAKLLAEPGELVSVGEPLVEFQDGASDTGTVAGRLPDEEARPAKSDKPPPRRAATEPVKAAPAVRALARQLDIDLTGVEATGNDGQITADDVRRSAGVVSEAAPAQALRGVRRSMARRMMQAHREVVPATLMDEAVVGHWPKGGNVTIRLVRALAAGVKAVPVLNAWYEADTETLRVLEHVDVGIAVDTPDGLLVPVLRNVAARDPDDLRAGLDRLKQDAAARRIPPEELRAPTITLSNFGALGAGRFAQLVVVPPQVAIVGAGRIRPASPGRTGAESADRLLPLSLTFDHRVVDGGDAARFMAAVIADLADSE